MRLSSLALCTRRFTLLTRPPHSLVLDGEMLVWDPVLGKYMPFGNLKTFALAKTFGSSDPRPCCVSLIAFLCPLAPEH